MDTIETIVQRYAESAAAVLDPRPARVVRLVAGATPVWDECCQGQLTLAVKGMEPRYSGPKLADGTYCNPPTLEVTASLLILRCATVATGRLPVPTPQMLEADGLQMVKDGQVLLELARCSPDTLRVLSMTPRGPQGGCYGAEVTFVFEACWDCD